MRSVAGCEGVVVDNIASDESGEGEQANVSAKSNERLRDLNSAYSQ